MKEAIGRSRNVWPHLFLASAALSSFILVTPAFASDAKCLWDHLPQADLDAFKIQISKDRIRAVQVLSSKVDATTINACHIPEERLSAAEPAFGAFAQEQIAIAVLASRFDIKEPRLIAAWNSLPQQTRQRYSAIAHMELPSTAEKNFQVDVMLELIAKFPGSSPDAEDQLSYYFYSHAYMTTEN